MSQSVIALAGPAGAGKSTVANHLVEVYGAVRASFAGPLKEVAKRTLDFTDEQLYGTQEQKEAIDPRYGFSCRTFLQKLGTEGCRGVFGEDFWTRMCLESIFRQNQRLVVIEDCRFISEAQSVLDDTRFNGFVWRLHPPADAVTAARAAAAGVHTSEQEWQALPANLEIQPDKRGIPELLELIGKAMVMVPLRDRGAIL